MTFNPGGNPLPCIIVPDVPLVPSGDAALVPPDKSHAIEKLVQIELNGLGRWQIRSVKIYVVSKVVERGHQRVIGVGHPLRREIADQVIIEQHVPVRTGSAEAKLR